MVKNIDKFENEEENVRIKLEKHLWPDEIKQRKKARRVKTLSIIVIIFIFFMGIAFGVKYYDKVIPAADKQLSAKFDAIVNIMENQWYFGAKDPSLVDGLFDDAIKGVTTKEKDPHTYYMSSEDLVEFTQSIDMGFVGIGVQYTTVDGNNIITQVFHGSPADISEVQEGDIIYKVDGTLVSEIPDGELPGFVKGEENTVVVIEFLRGTETITKEIVRGPVLNTAFGEMIDETVGYLEIYQFGSSTGFEVTDYLKMMSDQGMEKLIIDLRNNGGGYLGAFIDVCSSFVDEGEIIMQQEYADGTVEYSYAKGGKFDNINQIVILGNGNSASASEVLIMALTELREDTIFIGETTYGKGTVQNTHTFSDTTALKYTTSVWKSPSGVWVDEDGILPSEEVLLHDILYLGYEAMANDEKYELDSVSTYNVITQNALDFLGYDINRFDGYFDEELNKQIKLFQTDYNLNIDGILDSEVFGKVMSEVTKAWALEDSNDAQLNRAIDILHGK